MPSFVDKGSHETTHSLHCRVESHLTFLPLYARLFIPVAISINSLNLHPKLCCFTPAQLADSDAFVAGLCRLSLDLADIMYRFQAQTFGGQTCRFWLLSPTGCTDRFCKYTHSMTGTVSPPSSFACYAYNNGGCQLAQDQCLFAHLITGPQHPYLQICRASLTLNTSYLTLPNTFTDPQLSLRDFPIAEAAAKAGFDCGSWPKLKNLIDAVRKAEFPSYPNRSSGPDAWTSPIYPDRYHAEQQRARKGVAQAYKETDIAHRAATVPAFVVPAKQLIDNIRNGSRAVARFTPPSSGKRGHENFIDLTQDSRKRLKTKEPSYSQGSNYARTPSYVDLTQDELVKTPEKKLATNRPALVDISNNIPRPGTVENSTRDRRKREREQRYRHIHTVQEKSNNVLNRANENAQQTSDIIARIGSRLHATAADIDADRNVLRQLWEFDNELKDQGVTNDLAELNECFTRAEEAIMYGTAIIEERLLSRR